MFHFHTVHKKRSGGEGRAIHSMHSSSKNTVHFAV